MKTQVIITDVTRMKAPRVCIGAVKIKDKQTIRPVFQYPEIIKESHLYKDEEVIRPFALVTLELLQKTNSAPPHTEDWVVNPKSLQVDRVLNQDERLGFLESILDPSVDAIFGAEIFENRYICEKTGTRSLGTIHVKAVLEVQHKRIIAEGKEKLDYRVTFLDPTNIEYTLPVTDLSFRYYVDYLRQKKGWSFEKISSTLTKILHDRDVFMRVGLARSLEGRCYLQITGIYSFPDYLEGRCFADFYQPEFTESIPF